VIILLVPLPVPNSHSISRCPRFRIADSRIVALLGLAFLSACSVPAPESSRPQIQKTAREVINETLSDPSVTTLHLDGPRVTDGDLLLLTNTEHITSILIDSSDITEKGLNPLTSMQNLIQLRLRTRLTDAAIPFIMKMTQLQFLNLPQADFTDDGIQILSSHPNIQLLRIGGKRLSNKSLESIATMPSLSFLHLIGVPVDDQGLPALYAMQQLQSLYLDDTDVTDEGLVKLLGKLPRLHLHIDQNHIDRDPNKHEH
jgi:hypothetical protein